MTKGNGASDEEPVSIINRHLKTVVNLIAWHMRLWHEIPESKEATETIFWKLTKSGLRSKHEIAENVKKLTGAQEKGFFLKLHQEVEKIYSEIKLSKSSHAPKAIKPTPSPDSQG